MEDTTKDMLDREIESSILNLPTLENGSEERASAINDLERLYRMKTEEEEREKIPEKEKRDRRSKIFDRVITIAGIVSPFVLLGIKFVTKDRWMKMGYNFEKEGDIYTSDTFKDVRHDKDLM